jgi:hypothetical protein
LTGTGIVPHLSWTDERSSRTRSAASLKRELGRRLPGPAPDPRLGLISETTPSMDKELRLSAESLCKRITLLKDSL